MAWAARKITSWQLARHWALVYLVNLVGSLGSALMVHWSGALELGGGAVAQTASTIAQSRVCGRW